jgi:hypothetical protein
MPAIAVQGGKIIIREGKIGTEQSCCCPNNECKSDADCGDGRYCCDGTCQDSPCEPDCAASFFGQGWWTGSGREDLTTLLQNAGYVDVTWTPREPFPGSGLPFTDGCGQTFYDVQASCCGETFGCDPFFTVGNVRGIQGPGNQNAPCGPDENEVNFVQTCCNPLP